LINPLTFPGLLAPQDRQQRVEFLAAVGAAIQVSLDRWQQLVGIVPYGDEFRKAIELLIARVAIHFGGVHLKDFLHQTYNARFVCGWIGLHIAHTHQVPSDQIHAPGRFLPDSCCK
jgi:hypothetical protein